MIFEHKPDLVNFKISKKILAVTYLGDFFIYLINESNALPTKFIIVNANKNSIDVSKDNIDILKEKIADIKNLDAIPNFLTYQPKEKKQVIVEAISEVQEKLILPINISIRMLSSIKQTTNYQSTPTYPIVKAIMVFY